MKEVEEFISDNAPSPISCSDQCFSITLTQNTFQYFGALKEISSDYRDMVGVLNSEFLQHRYYG